MTQNTKRTVLLLLSAALVSVVFLSASLSNLQFQPGVPLPGGGNSAANSSSFTALTSASNGGPYLLQGLLALIFLGFSVYLPFKLAALIDLKRALLWLLVLPALLLLILLLPRITPGQSSLFPAEAFVPATGSSSKYPVSSLGSPPPGVIWLVVAVLVFGMGLLVVRMLKPWPHPGRITNKLSQEAEAAFSAIKLGKDLRGVIIRCYLQMTHAVQEEQQMERSRHMTAREFEAWLGAKGFPLRPLHQLTGLFEKARYDSQPMAADDERAAVESLDEIIRFCRRGE